MTDSHETRCPICRGWYENSAYGCPECEDAAESRADAVNDEEWINNLADPYGGC